MAAFVHPTDIHSALLKLDLSTDGGAARPLRQLQQAREAAKLLASHEAAFDAAWRSATGLLSSALATWSRFDQVRAREKRTLLKLLAGVVDLPNFAKAYRAVTTHRERERVSAALDVAIRQVNDATGARGPSTTAGDIVFEDAEVEKIRAIERVQGKQVPGARDVVVYPSQRGARERASLRRLLNASTGPAREQRWPRLIRVLHELAELSPETQSPLVMLEHEMKELRRAINVIETRRAS